MGYETHYFYQKFADGSYNTCVYVIRYIYPAMCSLNGHGGNGGFYSFSVPPQKRSQRPAVIVGLDSYSYTWSVIPLSHKPFQHHKLQSSICGGEGNG